ncbi:unnamed protein product [Protopolystoma xenopodis]|uniref:Uncharacterized protein n=1 Tax=Protopolystoma xenopodis TaxID=117903 RepID=A0A3S5CRD0_9PLAT|nr:unnamed protein product [Protopolystoma xenopodis]
MDLVKSHLQSLDTSEIERCLELEGLRDRLTETQARSGCHAKSEQLRKQMKMWTKGIVYTTSCLAIRLSDILDIETKGRWWIIGSALPSSTNGPPITEGNSDSHRLFSSAIPKTLATASIGQNLSPEVCI